MPPTSHSRLYLVRLTTGLVPCAVAVLVLWCSVGWLLQAIPGWLALATGVCVGLCSKWNRDAEAGAPSRLVHLFLVVIVCWGLILVGRFAGTIASVNHGEVWKSFRSATDDDGIGLLADEAAAESRETSAASANVAEANSVASQEPKAAALRRGREIWNSLSAVEKHSVLQRWRAKALWVDELAWSMILQQSFTQAYQGANLYWHLSGLAAALGAALIFHRPPDRSGFDNQQTSAAASIQSDEG